MGSKMYTNVHSIMSPSEHCICVLDCLTCYLLYFMSWKKAGRGGWKSKCKLGIKYQIHCFALITQWSESGNRDVLWRRSSSWYTDKHWGSTLYLCTSTSWPGPGYSVKNRGFKLIKQCWWVCWVVVCLQFKMMGDTNQMRLLGLGLDSTFLCLNMCTATGVPVM